MTSKDFKKIVNDRLFSCLKEHGFKRKGNNFKMEDLDLDYYIQIQSSSSSTSKIAKLTLNLGIVSKELITKENITDPDIGNSHWRQRIGNYRDKPQDYWWIIDSADKAEKASREIVDLIINRVLPEWEQIRSTADLKKIWESGNYSGLTDGQRKYYFELIDK